MKSIRGRTVISVYIVHFMRFSYEQISAWYTYLPGAFFPEKYEPSG